jgi:hypothetical protein
MNGLVPLNNPWIGLPNQSGTARKSFTISRLTAVPHKTCDLYRLILDNHALRFDNGVVLNQPPSWRQAILKISKNSTTEAFHHNGKDYRH